jgi:hypothetical protein
MLGRRTGLELVAIGRADRRSRAARRAEAL